VTDLHTLRFVANVSRVGEEAQVEVEVAGRKYDISNIRLPRSLKGVFPTSMRNPLAFNVMQKVTRNQVVIILNILLVFLPNFPDNSFFAI